MNQDVGPIILILQQQCCSEKAIGQMMAVAEHQEPGEPTLRLVRLIGTRAILAMIQEHRPGERMRLIDKLKRIPGVQDVG